MRGLHTSKVWFGLILGALLLSALPVPADPPPAVPEPPPTLMVALGHQSKALPNADWTLAPSVWTADMVRQVGEVLGVKERADKVVRSWADGAALLWTSRRNPALQVSVGAARFADAAGARAYCGLALDMQRKQDEWLVKASGGSRQVLESKVQSLNLPSVEEALRCDKKLQLAPEGKPTNMTTLWLRSGDLVLECCWYDVPADPAWGDKIAAALRTEFGRSH